MITNYLFIHAAEAWELEAIIQSIIKIKIQENDRPELTTLEEIILCGLLCGYHSDTVSQQLPGASSSIVISLTAKVQSYLRQVATQKLLNEVPETNDVLTLLSLAGYQKKINFIEPEQEQSAAISQSKLNQDSTKINIESQKTVPNQIKDNSLTTNKYPEAVLNRYYLSDNINNVDLPAINRWTIIGGLVTMGLVGIGFILAATIKYDVTVKANATVRPEGEIQLVQASKDGRIKSIEVTENQAVKRGQVIAYLDDSELRNKTQQLNTNVKQSQAKLTQIEAQITALETQIIAENNKSDRTIDSAEAELQNTQTEYQQKQITTQAKVDEAKAQLNIAQQELAKAETELQSLEANLKSTEASLSAAKSKRDRYQQILTSGAISQEQFEEAQLAAQQQEQTLASQKASLLGQKQTIEAQKQSVTVAKAQLEQAQATVNSDDAVVEMAQQAIEREKATKNATGASFMREKEALIQQKIDIEKQITEEKQQLQQLKQEIEQSVLKATGDGKILQLDLRNQNQVVNPQDTIAQIAPDATELVIKAQINPQDRDRVEVGQLVKLKIDACPYPDYGILSAKVTAISADTITSQDNEQKYYTAELTPATETLAQGDRNCPLRSGMSASADIITKAETPLQFFLRRARLITDW